MGGNDLVPTSSNIIVVCKGLTTDTQSLASLINWESDSGPPGRIVEAMKSFPLCFWVFQIHPFHGF